MPSFPLDLRKALRTLGRAPVFTASAVLTLALGMAVTISMFTALHHLLIRPLSFPEPERLVALWEDYPAQRLSHEPLSNANFQDWREQATHCFEGLGAWQSTERDLAGGDQAQRLSGLRVSPGFFDVLGVRAHLGSLFGPGQAQPGAPLVVLLSYELWCQRFSGDAKAIGQSLLLDGRPHIILGVLPQGFHFSPRNRPAFYLPLPRPVTDEARGFHEVRVLARLRRGATLKAAAAELASVSQSLAARYPDTNQGFNPGIGDLGRELVGDASLPLLLLMGAVAVLLLIACANVACLFLARTLARDRELAIRRALGAQVHQILALFLGEGLVVGLGGALAGWVGARLLLKGMPIWLPGGFHGTDFSLGPWSLLFTLGVALLASCLVALPPLLQVRLTRQDRDPGGSGRLRNGLVQAEVALAVLLLVSAGLLLRSLAQVLARTPGLEPRGVVQFQLELPTLRYAHEADWERFRAELQGRLQSLPGISNVGMTYSAFLSGAEPQATLNVGDTSLPFIHWPNLVRPALASPGLFETLRIPLRAGRTLQPSDTSGAPRVLVVNESLARKVFPDGKALGKQVRVSFWCDTSGETTLWEIVGVVGDVHHRSLEQPVEPTYYVPCGQFPIRTMVVYLRSRQGALAMAGLLGRELQAMDPALAVRNLCDTASYVQDSLGDRRAFLALLGGFAALALVLAGLGIHGVVAFAVQTRTWEIGVRRALGAQARTLLVMVLAQGLRHTLVGCLAGSVAALGAGRLLAHQLVGVGALDPLTLAAVVLLLTCVALLAGLWPALRAIQVDPVQALRAD